MVVYIIEHTDDNSDMHVAGVFSTREYAERVADTIDKDDKHRSVFVNAYEVDSGRLPPAIYAVTVTVKQGDQEVTKRYEAPTAEEAKRMAGECDVMQTPTGGR